MNTQNQLDRFREAASRAAPPASTVMFEMIARIEEMEEREQQPEPVAWIVTAPVDVGVGTDHESSLQWEQGLDELSEHSQPLYLSPPAPAVPDWFTSAVGSICCQSGEDPAKFMEWMENGGLVEMVISHFAPNRKAPALPDGSITTEMKIACLGEFSWTEEWPYYNEEGCLHEDHVETHAVPWSLCKEIYRAMLAAAPKPPAGMQLVPDAYIEKAEKYITEACCNAVEKLNELAPEMGWDAGEKTAEIYIRKLREAARGGS